MKDWLMSYLTFSKKERTGILVLLVLILTIWLLPEYYNKPQPLDMKITAKLDSMADVGNKEAGVDMPLNTYRLFYFDPNTATDKEWVELGLKTKTIGTIRNYLAKGGRFRQPGDIGRIYGIRKDEAERLMPYVKIMSVRNEQVAYRPVTPRSYPGRSGYQPYTRQIFQPYVKPAEQPFQKKAFQRKLLTVEINSADSADFEALPGIGIKLAARIIRFRETLGGFYTTDQLREVYGINDTVFNLIAASLKINTGVYRKVKINTWDADSLDIHPYIQKHEARAIVRYRKQHGRFNDPQDLSALGVISEDWITKMLPYLEFD